MWGLSNEKPLKKPGLPGLFHKFVGVFGVLGIVTLLITKAATPTAAVETENGTTNANCIVTDAAASGGKAIKFGNSGCGTPVSGGTGGAYGSTIPDTNYPVPTANVIFMSPNGDDASAGTSPSAPVKTIGTAVNKASSGWTIVMRGGIYRDSHAKVVNGAYTKLSKNITIQAYPHEQAWFDGTDVVTSWTSDGQGHWSTAWDTPDFCHEWQLAKSGGYYQQIWPWNGGTPSAAGPCVHKDMFVTSDPNADPDPQMAFRNGTALKQVGSLAAVSANTFFFDIPNRKMFIGTDPSGQTIELAKRPVAFVLEGGAGGNIIRGIGFRRFATNEKVEGSYTHGSLFINVPNVTFENNTIAANAGAGIGYGTPKGAIFRGNIVANNGYDGMSGNGSVMTAGSIDNLQILNNVFYGNNAALFGLNCNISCGQAGIKLAHIAGYTLKNNLFENQMGSAHGFWCDMACVDGVHVNNVLKNNGGAGIYYEISDRGIIASNLAIGNKAYGIKSGSANTKVYNNTLVNNRVGMLIYDDNRYPGMYTAADNHTWNDAGPSTVNMEVANNVMYTNATTASGHMIQSWRTSSDTTNNTGPNTFYSIYDANSYYRPNGAYYIAEWRDGTSPSFTSVLALRGAHPFVETTNAQDISDGSNPFANLAAGDYNIRPGATTGGRALPSDVAAKIGVSAGGTTRGAYRYWPNGN
ncbi:right-handed parallel beta-helix repeat-containing protein [Candidatus Saccharibacteria bacterium]|nr:MAG: right-handed parallel beta-helix repeat-containing protein [Candidatus Saccharibacteria bacterium]